MRSILDKLYIFIGKEILDAYGNTKKINLKDIKNRKIINIDSYGKLLLIYLDNSKILRIHFLMYGSYSINIKKKDDKYIRLALKFENDELFFYNCSINLVDKIEKDYRDILDKDWDYKPVLEYLKNSENYICDDLLDQKILPGVGNIIKVESLFRSKIHPREYFKKYS